MLTRDGLPLPRFASGRLRPADPSPTRKLVGDKIDPYQRDLIAQNVDRCFFRLLAPRSQRLAPESLLT
jgi:hypothetical protein